MQAKTLDKITIIYLIIPMVIFLIGWLNPLVALVSCTVLLIVVFQVFKGLLNRKLEIKKSQLIFMFLIAVVWCILAGIGGLYYQSTDWHMRNAIFRDLVNFSYPVIYDNGAALVYYMGFFLPGAIVGKLVLFLHASPEWAYKIGCLFSLLYSSVGIGLLFLHLMLLTNAKKKQYFLIILLFILFSGLDILFGSSNYFGCWHIEWHKPFFQLSSNTTLLFWVYNQAIAPWLLTALFLRRPYNISNYGFLGTLGLFYAPMPFIGLFIYLISMAIFMFLKRLNKRYFIRFLKNLFNIKNILSIFVLLPIFYLYYSSNLTASSRHYSIANPLIIWFNVLVEVGIFLFIIYKNNRKNPIYYVTVFILFFCTLFKLKGNADFCMRTTIPVTFVLFVLVVKYLLFSNNKVCKVILSIALLLGMVTPIFEFSRGIFVSYIFNLEKVVKDDIFTLNNKIRKDCKRQVLTTTDALAINFGNYKNYGAVDLDKHIFFKYLAKRPRK